MSLFIENIIHYKTPKHVIQLANFLCDFIYDVSDNYDYVYKDIYNLKEKKNINITSICADVKGDILKPRLFGLYYNSDTKLVVLQYVNPDTLDLDIINYLNSIFINHSVKDRDYVNTMKKGKRVWLDLNHINDIINDITVEKYKIYTNILKYKI